MSFRNLPISSIIHFPSCNSRPRAKSSTFHYHSFHPNILSQFRLHNLAQPLGRPLANPLSNTWGNKTFAPVNYVDTGKVARQKLDITVSHNIELAIYHTKGKPALRLHHQVPSLQMQFTAHPTLMNDLQITESTWFDLYMNGDWRTFQAATPFAVDKQRPSILRLRPSLREELAIEDCPDVDNLMSQQRKRVGTDLVSPAKKLARTDTASTLTQARQIIEIPDSPPPTPSTSASHPSEQSSLGHFPLSSTRRHGIIMQPYEIRVKKTSIEKAFPTLFPGAAYASTTMKKWRGIFLKAPKEVVDHFIAHGKTPAGLFSAFWDRLQAYNKSEPLPANHSTLLIKSEIPSIPVLPAPPTAVITVDACAPTPLPIPNNAVVIAADFGLCFLCDVPFTVAPSAKLVDLRAKLIPLSNVAPTPANPDHCIAQMTHQATAFCKQHEADSLLLPFARANQLPEYINYAELSERLDPVIILLQEILEDLEASEFFATATNRANNEKFEKSAGYFGELGYTVISRKIMEVFPAATIMVEYTPLSWGELIEQVLIPEALVALIADELKLSPEDAVELLHSSTPFGLEYHSDILDRDRCTAKTRELAAASFPISSPLLAPHALSPTLAPVSWEREPSPIILEHLCSYCDQQLPIVPSETLVTMGQSIAG
ncbi:hypothetical protein B0H19DRAFT_1253094 [Mycena capillaripes]|nr:hypothetical protein B0H19DRAFT_1253094 [Mycena capillaripes]